MGAVSPFLSDNLPVLGVAVPARHGKFSDEYRALSESAALLPMPWDASLQVVGKDAGTFLHNLLTQDILALNPGESSPAALASRHGHLEADLQVARDTEGFRIRLQRRLLESFTGTLDRYRIMEDVEWHLDPDPQVSFLLAGPRAEGVCRTLCSSWDLDQMIVHEISEADVFLTLPQTRVSEFQETIGDLTGPEVPTVGWHAFNVLRIETGRAWFGIDADEERLVPEPGLSSRISYNKGC